MKLALCFFITSELSHLEREGMKVSEQLKTNIEIGISQLEGLFAAQVICDFQDDAHWKTMFLGSEVTVFQYLSPFIY